MAQFSHDFVCFRQTIIKRTLRSAPFRERERERAAGNQLGFIFFCASVFFKSNSLDDMCTHRQVQEASTKKMRHLSVDSLLSGAIAVSFLFPVALLWYANLTYFF